LNRLKYCQASASVPRRQRDEKNELTTTFVWAPGALLAPATWGTSQWSIFFRISRERKKNNRLITSLSKHSTGHCLGSCKNSNLKMNFVIVIKRADYLKHLLQKLTCYSTISFQMINHKMTKSDSTSHLSKCKNNAV
jgi:hypothetical protein